MGRSVILGAGGFIGQSVRRGYEIEGIDELWLVGRRPVRDDGRWFQLELTDRNELSRFINNVRPDVVVNCAGRTGGSAEDLQRANVDVVSSVLAALERSEMATRLIHIGSSAEYGEGTPGVPMAEGMTPNPVSAYGRAKLEASQRIMASNADAAVLRVFNPIGPGAGPSSLIGHAVVLLRQALEIGAQHFEMGPLDAYRDFLHVDDVADAVISAGRAVSVSRTVTNIGSGRARQARDLVHLLADVAGFNGQITESPSGSARSAEVHWQQADASQARRRLGWSARRDLRSALESAWLSESGIRPARISGHEPPARGPSAISRR
jgi:nucleoside-diphosphate-sugar epimerase